MKPLVVGIGHPYRRDDAFGLVALEGLKSQSLETDFLINRGDPLLLVEQWQGRDLVIMLDAFRGRHYYPGEMLEVRLSEDTPLESDILFSTHTFSLTEVLVMAGELDKLPREMILILVQGRSFGYGNGLSPEVASAVPKAILRVKAILSR